MNSGRKWESSQFFLKSIGHWVAREERGKLPPPPKTVYSFNDNLEGG
jgi:hypothetical protein